MKILCDVCNVAPATLMCCADDAALCYQCDTRIHAANKLASKHQRVPLLTPGPDDAGTCCDICQEKAGYFFCLEDRALLCRNCDVSIHSANALTANHKRYLVTGIRVGLQVTSGQSCAYSTNSAQVSSQRQASKKPRSPGSGSAVLNFPSQPPTPVSQQAAAYLGSMSTTQQTPSINFATQRASSCCVGAVAAQQSSYGSVVPDKVVGDSPVAGPMPVQQVSLSSWRPPTIGEIRSDGVISSNQNKCEGLLKKSSGSEFFTEMISGWKVDELVNFNTDPATTGNLKKDIPSFEDVDWNSDFSDIDEHLFGESLAEVPSLPSPPIGSGLRRAGRFGGLGKGKRQSDSSVLLDSDDYLVVPDSVVPTLPPLKRRTAFLEI